MGFLDGIVEEDSIYKGAARLVYAAQGQSFPSSVDSIMSTFDYTLQEGWNDLGGTTPDGVRLVRGFDKDPGVEVDQIKSNIMKGRAGNWRGGMGTNLLETDVAKLKILWQGGTARTVGAEKLQDFGSPETLTEQLLAAVQKHSETGKFRAIVIRKATIAGEDMEIPIQSGDASAVPISWEMEADTSISLAEDNMFRVIEQQ